MLWHIGNTTVRTPYRLQEALRALAESPLNGNLSGREQEQRFAEFLDVTGIVEVRRLEQNEDASDVGRKWRSALSQLGFVTPRLTRRIDSGAVDPVIEEYSANIPSLTGRQYEITPNGERLAEADTVPAQQECFLRALVAYRIPSVLETGYRPAPEFSPLHFVLGVMYELGTRNADPNLTFDDFALHVQTASPADGLPNVAQAIMAFRQARVAARGNVRAFDNARYDAVAAVVQRERQTLDDYTDLSFRYLKATGLFRNVGRGIGLAPNRARLAALLRGQQAQYPNDHAYLETLWRGADLPTDDINTARVVVDDLAEQLTRRNVPTRPPPARLPLPLLNVFRHRLEQQLAELDEKDYAAAQAGFVEEIGGWLEALETQRPVTLADGTRLSVPKGDAPVYLEWAIWRAFLAIDSLENPPWDCRKFAVDQDFLPVHCAPGGGPDMVFEFENAIIVVEVTLTRSSRQEAAEGEPVRRHVAQYASATAKPVYGLFLAVQIDSNTAHTFSAGAWYLPDDRKISLNIVPMTVSDFRRFFVGSSDNLAEVPQKLRNLLVECRAAANQDAPQWKQSITEIANRLSVKQ
jgi:hypothetical protein